METGSVTINVPNFRLRNAEIQGTINLGPRADYVVIVASRVVGFEAVGVSQHRLRAQRIRRRAWQVVPDFIWPGPNGDPSDGWTITANTFRGYQCGNPHSEALYIAAYAAHGLIGDNTFVNNGNTAHIFFTWCNWDNDFASWGGGHKDPHDWPVRCLAQLGSGSTSAPLLACSPRPSGAQRCGFFAPWCSLSTFRCGSSADPTPSALESYGWLCRETSGRCRQQSTGE
jgi:hypothetical protein